MKSILTIILSFAIVPLVAGCGSKSKSNQVEVFPVSGQLTWKGEPVAGADLVFFNADSEKSAFGRTDDQGRYQLTTFSANDGAVAGQQVITVTKTKATAEPVAVAETDSTDYVPPGLIHPGRNQRVAKPKPILPEKFSSQSTSTLTAVVEENNKNVIDLTLDD
ncbi:hypothetical protein [Thalassoglobus sp.]|uniref:hypothetical protein n=1 Tax=Thalassoglobus sp. TaxID=2795869 RepID=UPI003AA8826D